MESKGCCYKCEKRQILCHSTCLDYLKAKEEAESKKKLLKERTTVYDCYRIEKTLKLRNEYAKNPQFRKRVCIY